MNNKVLQTRFSKPFKLDNDTEILKLKLNKEDRFLIKNQEPFAAIWRGNNESSCFFAWISNRSNKIIESKDLATMNLLLQNRIEEDIELKELIKPILDIVESGWYQIFYHEPTQTNKNFDNPINAYASLTSQNYNFWNQPTTEDYKSNIWIDGTIIFTQNPTTLNLERVNYYKDLIQVGKSPTIVTMSLAELQFCTTKQYLERLNNVERAQIALEYGAESIHPQLIIDGHHKAQAYIELNKQPSIINITRLLFKEEFDNNDWNYKNIEGIIENKIGEKLY